MINLSEDQAIGALQHLLKSQGRSPSRIDLISAARRVAEFIPVLFRPQDYADRKDELNDAQLLLMGVLALGETQSGEIITSAIEIAAK